MEWIELGYFGLFAASFLAATIVPVTSEAILLGMLALHFDPWLCLFTATIGNSLGSYLNYGIGRAGKPQWLSKIRIKKERILRWESKIIKYGVSLALLAWVPFIGDVISVALGFFRVEWKSAFLYMFIGKFVRYLVLVGIFLYA